VIAKRLNL